MTATEKKNIEEIVKVAKNLSKQDQEYLIRLGKDIIFINSIKNEKRD